MIILHDSKKTIKNGYSIELIKLDYKSTMETVSILIPTGEQRKDILVPAGEQRKSLAIFYKLNVAAPIKGSHRATYKEVVLNTKV